MHETLTVGIVLKPQGIRGEIKVKPYTDSAEQFRAFPRVFLDEKEYKVLSVRVGDGAVFLGLKGVPDRNAAELLRGKEVVVRREDAPAPEEGRYYIVDLIGCALCTQEGTRLGTLTDIRQAATDIYFVRQDDGKEILFPAVRGVIVAIDLTEQRITVDEKRFREVAVV